MQKVKIPLENMGFFSPQKIIRKCYGKNSLGEILLYYDLVIL
jgi:hypothetical protein